MPRPKSITPPEYCLHKPTGQGKVRLNGRDFYLGQHGTPESLDAYDRLIGEWLAGGRRPLPERRSTPVVLTAPVVPAASPVPVGSTAPVGYPVTAAITVVELIDGYCQHAKRYYRKRDGTEAQEARHIHIVLGIVRRFYGKAPAAAFGPLALKAIREHLIASKGRRGQGLSRKYINQQIERVVRMFRWGVENELVPPATLQALEAVPGLRRGKCEVREGKRVQPVPDAYVDAIQPHVSRQIWAVVELMRITGMRAGEVLIMRTIDIDRSGKVWEYRPEYHKGEHHDKERIIQIGPKAQGIIAPFIKPKLDAYLFSPADAYTERMEEKRQARIAAYRAKHPRARGNGIQPSQQDRSKSRPERKPRDRYDVSSLRRAICRACDVADAAAKDELRQQGAKVPEGRIVEQWHPHQLRHSAATRLRRQYGLEVARVILGHHSPAVTEIYAEADKKRALQVAAEVG